jgi:hypothetical protein
MESSYNSFLRIVGLNDFFAMLIFSFLLYYIETGYITMVFEDSINGKDNLPYWKNAKRLIICGLKGVGYSTIYATLVWTISTLIYFVYFGKIPHPFNYLNHISTIYDITSFDILFVILVILFSNLLPAVSWNTLIIPNTCPEFWNTIFLNYRLLSLLISCYIAPLIIFKVYNRKIEIKKCLSSLEYFLIATISGIYLILIFKYVVWLGIEKVFVIFYLLIVIARMFGVYFNEIKENL